MKKHIVPIVVVCLIFVLLGGGAFLLIPRMRSSLSGTSSVENFTYILKTPIFFRFGQINSDQLTVIIPDTKPLGEKIAEEQARLEAERAAEEAAEAARLKAEEEARLAREEAERVQGFENVLDNAGCTSVALYRLRDDYLGGMVASRNADEQLAPASTTKLMTALLTAEICTDLTAKVTIPTDIWEDLEAVDASTSGFNPGEEVTVEDILYGIILPSGCDACVAAARYISGSEEAFAELMNQKAEELGMTNTHYITVHGLYVDGHYTSANDMIKLLKACYENDIIRKVMLTAEYTAPDGTYMHSFVLSNFPTFDVDEDVTILGGKTGYSKMVGQNLCTVAEIHGDIYLLVTLGCHGSPYNGDMQHYVDQAAIWNALAEAYRNGKIITETSE